MLNTRGKFFRLSCITLSTTILLSITPSIQAYAADIATEETSDINQTKNDWTPSSGGNVTDDFKNSDNNELGYAAHFHIFAKEANLSTHTNGNLAVANLSGDAGFGTNIKDDMGKVEKDISYIQNVSKMESSSFVSSNGDRTNKVTFGTDNDVLLSDTEELMVNTSTISHLTKDEVFQDQGNNTYIDFDSYFNVLAQKSQAITQRDAHDKLNDKNFAEDINNRVIELDDYTPNKENKIAFDLDSSVLEKSTPLKIKGLSSEAGGTNIVINVDLKGKSSYDMKSQIQLFYTDGNSTDPTNRPNHETEYFDDNHILWNFYDSSQADGVYRGTINFDAPFQGSVLATSATVTVNHNLDGNIIAEVVNVKGETHRWDYQNDSSYDEAVDEDKNPEPTKPDIDESDEEDFDEDLSTDSGNEPDTDDGENSTDDSNEEDVDSNTDLDTDENESTEDPDGKDIEPDTDTDSSSNPDTDQKPNTDSNSELPITNGSSESSFGQETTPKTQSTRSLSTGKALPNVLETVQNDVATPSSTSKNSSGLFPSTGGTSGLIASILGLALLALLAVFSIIKVIKIRKNN